MPLPAQSCIFICNIGPDRTHQLPRVWEFVTTLEADLVRSFLDRDNAAQFVVVTAEGKLVNPKQQSHKSSARCRCSQLPFTSSQSSSERTLARASAIEQSAAP